MFLKPDLGKLSGKLLRPGAAAADPVKVSYVPCDVTVKIGSGKLLDALDTVHLQIHHSAAFRADKVIVGRGIGIEVVYTVAYAQTGNLPDVGEKGKVAVYGSQADVWILLPDIHVYNVGCGMILPGHQKFFDHFPLPAVF